MLNTGKTQPISLTLVLWICVSAASRVSGKNLLIKLKVMSEVCDRDVKVFFMGLFQKPPVGIFYQFYGINNIIIYIIRKIADK